MMNRYGWQKQPARLIIVRYRNYDSRPGFLLLSMTGNYLSYDLDNIIKEGILISYIFFLES